MDLEELDELLRSVVHGECAGHRVVLPLSGGLDSRLLAGASSSQGSDPARSFEVNGLTYGYSPTSAETRIGRQVAAASGVPCYTFQVHPYVLDDLDRLVDTFEGALSLTVPRQAGVVADIARLGDRVLGGHWGDVWLDSTGWDGSDGGDLAHAALSKFRKRGSEWLMSHLCKPQLRGDPDEVVSQLILAEADRIPSLGDPDMELKILKTEQWSFRWTLASVRAYQLAAFPALPFYEPRLVDALMQVPSSLHRARSLQIDWIRRCYPELAAVRWQVTGHDLLTMPPGGMRSLAARAWSKAHRVVRREHIIERNWELQLHADAQRTRVRELLVDGPIGAQVGVVEIDRLMGRFGGRVNPALGYTVDMLLTVSECLRRYG